MQYKSDTKIREAIVSVGSVGRSANRSIEGKERKGRKEGTMIRQKQAAFFEPEGDYAS